MTKVAVLDDWQDVARDHADWTALREHCQVDFFPDPIGNEDEMARRLGDYEILLTVQDRTHLPSTLLDRLPLLQMIGVTIGNANLDIGACAKRGIVVSHTDGPDENGGWAPAELALGLLISAFRNIPLADRAVRSGVFQHGVPTGRALAGRVLGIVGLGRLGSRLAGYANALGMQVLAWNPGLNSHRAKGVGATAVSKQELFTRADAVSIHAKLTANSRGLIDGSDLQAMKPGAVLVNTSRGPIVDESALLLALTAGRLTAALDVFDDEPLPIGHPLTQLSNTVLTPHLGFGVEETWETFYPQSVENVLAFLAGHPVRTLSPGAS